MSKGRRHIMVVTGTRAEFGLLEPVMREIEAHHQLKLSVAVTGMHLVAGTWRDVKRTGFEINARVPMQKRGEAGRLADVAALGRGISGFAKLYAQAAPDFVLVLGDRIEVFAAAGAASVAGIRVAHVHGGDRAEGVADEAMRHAVSKLAHVHLVATALSRKRLVRMGEREEMVFNVGSPAVDGLRDVVAAEDAPQVIVLQHPVGKSDAEEEKWMSATLRGIPGFAALSTGLGGECVVMAPNGDAGCVGVRRAMRKMKVEPIEHLPRERWLTMLAGARVIVGNSSAGLIEAAVLKTACVNVGPRQGGRERPGNVMDCDYGQTRVRDAIKRAMALDLRRMRHPYGDGRSGERIAETLAKLDLRKVSVRKRNAY